VKPRRPEATAPTAAQSSGVRHLFTAAEAERRLGIRSTTIRQWARRGKLFKMGLDERGKPMYDREDLRRLAAA
jgi:predicted site-specific integrase-resolvase